MTDQQLDEERIFRLARGIANLDLCIEYLDQICGSDLALRDRVEALLAADQEETDFLKSVDGHERPTVDHVASNEKPGTNIGRYKLMEQIGEGGIHRDLKPSNVMLSQPTIGRSTQTASGRADRIAFRRNPVPFIEIFDSLNIVSRIIC